MEVSPKGKMLSSNNPYRRILEAKAQQNLIDFGDDDTVPRSVAQDFGAAADIFGEPVHGWAVNVQVAEEKDFFTTDAGDDRASEGLTWNDSRTTSVLYDDLMHHAPTYTQSTSEQQEEEEGRREGEEASETESDPQESSNEEATSPEPTSPFDPNQLHRACEDCEQVGPNRLFCNVCNASFCRVCWDRQLPHKKKLKDPNGNPHESTDQVLAERIQASLEPQVDEERQDELHRRDEDTAWFGVVRDIVDGRIFEDYGRFASLMAESQEADSTSRYPGIVSFVGQTGAGKSTLIKLLIELHYRGKKRFPAPVVGSVRCHHSSPTTGDVHLYSDPHTHYSDHPMTYVDVEGLEGGERTPIGATKTTKRNRISLRTPQHSPDTKVRKGGSLPRRRLHHTSEREITWATTLERKTREFTVLNLYPRILYTFSDVVVFVLKNPKTIENVVERLLIWASQALEKSSNQPVLPHAIIALNAMSNNIDSICWDVTNATRLLLNSINCNFESNSKFTRFVEFWKDRGREVSSIRELLLSYYSNIRVVYIPRNGRPNLISEQIQRLYSEITTAVESSREIKRSLRMLLSTIDIQPYFQCAFDHFACDLDTPFDFVQASFANNPIPLDFGGSILKLALSIMNSKLWKERKTDDARIILRKMSRLIASCIMLDSARHKTCGTAENIFPEYLTPLDNFLDDFCNRHWPCEFQSTRGVRCVNVKSGHAKGHQLRNGRVIAGAYTSRLDSEDYRNSFRNGIYKELVHMLMLLRTKGSQPSTEVEFATQLHKDHVLGPFFVDIGGADSYTSHSTCLSCLVGIAEHALPCGHLMCTACLQGYGTVQKTFVEIRTCPLHEAEIISKNLPWRVLMKPASAGVRVLSLDGGGIRSIIQLEMLRQVEQALGGVLPIQVFFDLIVGTSTGGVVALGLGAKNWPLLRCADSFREIIDAAFTKRRLTEVPFIKAVVRSYQQSKHETQPLQNALIQAFSEEEALFGGIRAFRNTSYKVAVTSTLIAGKPVVIGSYNRRGPGEGSYIFQRPEDATRELKTWEAARATTAATKYFRPFSHESSKQEYVDGSTHHNNPIHVADLERRLLWPDMENAQPDLILSLGSGFAVGDYLPPVKPLRQTSGFSIPSPQRKKNGADKGGDGYRSCEQVWEDFLNVHVPQAEKHRYVRLNVDIADDSGTPPKFDNVGAMQRLEDLTRAQMMRSPMKEVIRDVADHLIASTFYFEKTGVEDGEGDTGYIVTGTINCRFAPYSPENEDLGEFLRDLRHHRDPDSTNIDGDWSPYFVVQERGKEKDAEYYRITDDVIEDMMSRRRFSMGTQLRIPVSSAMKTTEILLCLDGRFGLVGGGRGFPISGFPRDLLREDERKKAMRPERPNASKNWRKTTEDRDGKGTWRSPPLPQARNNIVIERTPSGIKLQPPPPSKRRKNRLTAMVRSRSNSMDPNAVVSRGIPEEEDLSFEVKVDSPPASAGIYGAISFGAAGGGGLSPYTETRTARLYTETTDRVDMLRVDELMRMQGGGSEEAL